MLKNNRGITLIEVIVVLGVIGLIAPIIMNYVIEAFRNNVILNEKVRLQTTVSALMSNLERNIKEAAIPITEDQDGEDASTNKTVIIKKPNDRNAEFSFISASKQVIYTDPDGKTVTYDNIVGFYFKKVGNLGAENGAEMEIKAQLNNNSYSLKNTYYTRNMDIL